MSISLCQGAFASIVVLGNLTNDHHHIDPKRSLTFHLAIPLQTGRELRKRNYAILQKRKGKLFPWHLERKGGSNTLKEHQSDDNLSTDPRLENIIEEFMEPETGSISSVREVVTNYASNSDLIINLNDLVLSLKCCDKPSDLNDGRYLHSLICKYGLDRSIFIGNCLIQMYGQCGSTDEAQLAFYRLLPEANLFSWNLLMKSYLQNGYFEIMKLVFEALPCKDVISWTCMIKAFTLYGKDKEALHVFYEMQRSEDIKSNKVTHVCILSACNTPDALDDGYEIHASIIYNGYEVDDMIGTSLISMYGRCHSLCSARIVFCLIDTKDIISWNSMISACTENFQSEEALDIYFHMLSVEVKPDSFTFVTILDACRMVRNLEVGKSIHSTILNTTYKNAIAVNNALITFYGKCFCLDIARGLFEEMKERDAITWNAMIAACTQNSHEDEALDLFHRMLENGFVPNNITFFGMVDECTSLAKGFTIHTYAVKFGHDQDVLVGNVMVNFYGKFQNMDEAEAVFWTMPQRDVASWNNLIHHKGHVKESIQMFCRMQLEGIVPDQATFIYIVDTCATLEDFDNGRVCHVAIQSSHHHHDLAIGIALLRMYGKCGRLDEAKTVFAQMPQKNIVSWNAIIKACVQNGENKEALNLFYQLQEMGMCPDKVTFLYALNVCDVWKLLEEGRKLHAIIISVGYGENQEIGHALISMYGKCHSLEDSNIVFNRLNHKTVVSWNAVLTACRQNMHETMALALFHQMENEHVEPDKITYICALDACASIAALSEGESIHNMITDKGWEIDTVVGNALINMYGKCGNINKAMSILRNMSCRDVVSWSSLIAICAQNGQADMALSLFQQMKLDGVDPNHISFTCALTACSQVGLIDHGRQYFASITKDYGMVPTLEHYVCIIDLLSRSGHLDEAEELIGQMPYKKVPMVCLNLLGACHKYGDVERGEKAFMKCLELESDNSAPYVIMANLYSSAGMHEDAAKVREALKSKIMRK